MKKVDFIKRTCM